MQNNYIMIKFVVFDYDGVFTNGSVIFNNKGTILKSYNAKDGMGIKLLRQAGLLVGVISGYKFNESQKSILDHLNIDKISLGSNDKMTIISNWCKDIGIYTSECAFMGDDINDVCIMENIKYNGCPLDAHKQCKKLSDFISTKKGGDGCIREFCEYVLKIVDRYKAKVSALVPCRHNSSSHNFDLRKFNRTTLFETKLNVLKNMTQIDEVVVSTNVDNIDKLLDDESVCIHKRSDELCKDNINNSTLFDSYCKSINNDVLIYTSPKSPFIKACTLDAIIKFWRNNPKYDVVCAGKKFKEYTWKDNKPNNFAYNDGIINRDYLKSQSIALNNCAIIFDTKVFNKHKSIFGDCTKVFMYEIDDLEEFMVSSQLDFTIAENLMYKEFDDMNKIINYQTNSSYSKCETLDCTIRDSGYLNNWSWSEEFVEKILYYMGEIGVTYCEIGFIMDKKYIEKDCGIWRHINDDWKIVKRLKKSSNTKIKIAVMFDIGTGDYYNFDYHSIPPREETGIDLIRVCCYYDILDRISDVCNVLANKGYTLTINIMYSSHLTSENIINIKKTVKELPINYLYFADSIGGLTQHEIYKFMIDLKDIYPIKNGFHNHDNNGTVLGNIINLLHYNIDIVDGTISGMGKNGGNASIDQVIMYLYFKENYDLHIEYLFEFLEWLNISGQTFISVDMTKSKEMLQQFMNIHGSHTTKHHVLPLPDYYQKLKKITKKSKDII